MAYIPPDPAAIGITTAQAAGDQVLDLAIALAPVAVPFVLSMAALRWALNKMKVGGSVSLVGGWNEKTGEYGCRDCGRPVPQGEGRICYDCRYERDEEARSMY